MTEYAGYDEWLPEQTGDDRDEGWGEPPAQPDADEAHLLDERPPHHGG